MEAVATAEREGRVREAGRPAAVPIDERVSEAEFMADVVAFAKRHGWLVYHTRDSRKSEAGFPDLVLIRGEVLAVAELKVGKNEPTAAQRTWLEAFEAAGVKAFTWYPRDWPAIAELLE